MQARWFEDRLSGEDEELAFSVDVILDAAVAIQLPNFDSHINRWWFDERP